MGVFTGDYGKPGKALPVSYSDARVMIMTPERFDACTRSWRTHWSWIPEVDWLVVDELHLLGDGQRRTRLEGTISRFRRLNPFCRVSVFPPLSVTAGNSLTGLKESNLSATGGKSHSNGKSCAIASRMKNPLSSPPRCPASVTRADKVWSSFKAAAAANTSPNGSANKVFKRITIMPASPTIPAAPWNVDSAKTPPKCLLPLARWKWGSISLPAKWFSTISRASTVRDSPHYRSTQYGSVLVGLVARVSIHPVKQCFLPHHGKNPPTDTLLVALSR